MEVGEFSPDQAEEAAYQELVTTGSLTREDALKLAGVIPETDRSLELRARSQSAWDREAYAASVTNARYNLVLQQIRHNNMSPKDVKNMLYNQFRSRVAVRRGGLLGKFAKPKLETSRLDLRGLDLNPRLVNEYGVRELLFSDKPLQVHGMGEHLQFNASRVQLGLAAAFETKEKGTNGKVITVPLPRIEGAVTPEDIKVGFGVVQIYEAQMLPQQFQRLQDVFESKTA